MYKVCLLIITKSYDLKKMFKELQDSQQEIVLLIDSSNLLSEEDKLKILNFIHSLNKKVMIALKEEAIPEESDYVIIYNHITPSLANQLNRLSLPFIYKIIDSSNNLKNRLQEFESFIKDYSLQSFIILIAPTDPDLKKLAGALEESSLKDSMILLDIPSCVGESLNIGTTYRNFLDVGKVVYDNSDYTEEFLKTHSTQYRKILKCKECKNFYSCYGILNSYSTDLIHSLEHLKKPRSLFNSLTSKLLPIRLLTVGVRPLGLKAETEEERLAQEDIINLQNCRKGDLSGEDFFRIQTYKESMFFNRPFEEVELFSPDPRGLNSVNWIFIGKDRKDLSYKMKQDLLLPHHGFTLTCKVLFDDSWTEEEKEELDSFSMKTLMDIILENGGDPNLLEQKGNDLLYQGRKFCGQEWKFSNKFYIENTVVTTEYLPEKQWFDKLYHYKGEKQITGIAEEVPGVTKELLINELIKRFKERFSDHVKH